MWKAQLTVYNMMYELDNNLFNRRHVPHVHGSLVELLFKALISLQFLEFPPLGGV